MAETIGSLVDKLSIVGLKIYHMQEQIKRKDASESHRRVCKEKIKILKMQQKDLENELSELAAAVLNGEKRLKVYYQFKMYNDPAYRVKKPRA